MSYININKREEWLLKEVKKAIIKQIHNRGSMLSREDKKRIGDDVTLLIGRFCKSVGEMPCK